MKKFVFVCSKFKNKDPRIVTYNKNIAIQVCRHLSQKGYIPLAPHLYFPVFLDDRIDSERNTGIQDGIQFLNICDCVYVVLKNKDDKLSEGMSIEVKEANRLGKEIRYIYSDDLQTTQQEGQQKWATRPIFLVDLNSIKN